MAYFLCNFAVLFSVRVCSIVRYRFTMLTSPSITMYLTLSWGSIQLIYKSVALVFRTCLAISRYFLLCCPLVYSVGVLAIW